MALPVKIKRRDESNADDNAPGSLLQGEIAFNEHSQVMHYGRGSSPSVVAIGGPGYLTRLPASTGFVVVNAARSGATMHTTVNRSVAGTSNEIVVTNGDGVSGNPTVGIADNAVMPGVEGIVLPSGTTAQRVNTEGYLRYNTDLNIIEWRDNDSWEQPDIGGGEANQNAFGIATGDSGTATADVAVDTLVFTGGEGIVTTASDGPETITIDMDIASLTNEDPNDDTDELVFDNGTNHRAVGFLTFSEKVFAKQKVVKASVRAATTTNGALATAYENLDVIDGVTLATNDRILIKNQTTVSENGVYIVNASGAPTRATDFDGNDEAELGQTVLVEEGTANAGRLFYTSTAPAVVGTNDWVWSQAGGGNLNVFSTIATQTGTNPVADSETDTLTISGGSGIVTDGNSGTDTVTISMDIAPLTAVTPLGADSIAFADNSDSDLTKRVTFGTLFSETFIVTDLTDLGAAPDNSDSLALHDNGTGMREMTIANLFTSPALTGNPTAPTAAQADNDTSIATTAFVRAVRLDQFAAPTATVDFNNQIINNLGTPTADAHAATKGYVDSLAQGLDIKASVVANSDSTSTEGTGYSYSATGGTSGRGQITWTTGPTTIDGVTLSNSDRILNTETGAAGGIYERTAQNTWDRATDFDEDDEVTAGAFTFVEEGTNYADSGWVLTTNDPITIGGGSGTSLSWAQFSGAGQVVAGAALTKTGNTLDVNVDDVTIEVVTDALQVKEGTANQVMVTNAGGTAAVWGAVDISAAAAVTGILGETNGGTGTGTYTTGDILYSDASNSLAKLGVGAAGQVLHVVGGIPAWAANIDGGTF